MGVGDGGGADGGCVDVGGGWWWRGRGYMEFGCCGNGSDLRDCFMICLGICETTWQRRFGGLAALQWVVNTGVVNDNACRAGPL